MLMKDFKRRLDDASDSLYRWISAIKASITKWLPLHQLLQEYTNQPPEETRMWSTANGSRQSHAVASRSPGGSHSVVTLNLNNVYNISVLLQCFVFSFFSKLCFLIQALVFELFFTLTVSLIASWCLIIVVLLLRFILNTPCKKCILWD